MAIHLAVAGVVFDGVFCAVLFPTRCLGWDLGLNWVSFWGMSYLLLHSESPYDIKKTIQISDLNFSLIKSSLSLSALHPVKASYSGKYLCMCIHIWVHINNNIYMNSDSKHCQLISPSYIGTALCHRVTFFMGRVLSEPRSGLLL